MKSLSDWIVATGLPRHSSNLNERITASRASACACVLLVVGLLAASGAMAQNLPAFPHGAEQREAQLMMRVGPQARVWIFQEARREAAQPEFSEQMTVAKVRAKFSASDNLSDADIMSFAFVVMMEATKSSQNDLKSIMEGVKSINEAKARERQNQTTIRSNAATSQRGNLSENSVATARKPMSTNSRANVTATPMTKAELDSQIDKAKNDSDSLSELGETQSMRLQMAMDRMSRMMTTLSNIEKKSSDTDSTITQNLK